MFKLLSFFAKFADTFTQTEQDKIDNRYTHMLEANNPTTTSKIEDLCKRKDVFKVKLAGKNSSGLFEEDKNYFNDVCVPNAVNLVIEKFKQSGKKIVLLLSEGDNIEMNIEGKFSPFSKAQFELIKKCLETNIPIYFIIVKSEPTNRFSKAFVIDWRNALFNLSNDFYTNNVFFGIVGNDNDNLKAWVTFDMSDLVIFIGTETRSEYKYKKIDDKDVPTTSYSQLCYYQSHPKTFEMISIK